MSNYKYKQSFYNIDLVKDGYVADTKEGVAPVYNTLRGKFGYIPKDIDYDNPPQNLLKEGFIVPYNIYEPQQYKQAQVNAINDEYPTSLALTICPTLACNYSCEYCFERCEQKVNMSEEIVSDTITFIKNVIDQNSKLRLINLKWFGGEPLLNMSAIREISSFVIAYCLSKNIQYYAQIVTNGYLFTKEISQELYDLNVRKAQIAIDGFENEYISVRKAPKDAYKRVLKNIEDSIVPVWIRINTTRTNQDRVIDLLKELSKLPSVQNQHNFIAINRVKDYSYPLKYGFTDKEWLEFRKQATALYDVLPTRLDTPRLLPCPIIHRNNIIISADGLLYRCDFQIGDKSKSIGSIKQGIIKNNDIDKKFVCSNITEKCLKCKYLPLCAGGLCRYAELKRGKDCELIKGRFRQNMQNYLDNIGSI